MSEQEAVSVGQTLRDAREAQNITLEDVSLRLRLMHRQVEAMEADDFVSLGQPVFARGFVRNYARLLGLQPEPLLERMEGAPAEPSPVTHAEPPLPRSWLTSPWLILLMLGMLVLLAVPVSLYLWLNSDAGEIQRTVPVVSVPKPAPKPVPVEPVPAEAPTETPAEAPADAPTEVPAEPAVPVAPGAGAAVPGEAGAPAAPTSPAPTGVVHLDFGDESWVEVRDGSGRMLHRQLNPAGSSVDIRGRPPFAMVVGNAAQARMTYNGRPIDLKPFVDVTVARFTLEE